MVLIREGENWEKKGEEGAEEGGRCLRRRWTGRARRLKEAVERGGAGKGGNGNKRTGTRKKGN